MNAPSMYSSRPSTGVTDHAGLAPSAAGNVVTSRPAGSMSPSNAAARHGRRSPRAGTARAKGLEQLLDKRGGPVQIGIRMPGAGEPEPAVLGSSAGHSS